MEEDKIETVFPLPLWALVLVFILCWPVMAGAETFSAQDAQGKITLTEEACTLGPWFEKWRAAKWFYRGKDYDACWSVQEQAVVLIDASGVVSVIPMKAFRPDVGV